MRARAGAAPATAGGKRALARGERAVNVVGILSKSAIIRTEIDAQLAQPLPELLRITSCLRYWTAFVRVKEHDATLDVWRPLCEALNIAMILCENGIGEQYLDAVIDAQEASFRAWMRGDRTGSYRLDGAGIGAIAFALEVHDAQIEFALRSDLATAERTMLARLDEGNHYKAEPIAA